jgi:hypothetical protein
MIIEDNNKKRETFMKDINLENPCFYYKGQLHAKLNGDKLYAVRFSDMALVTFLEDTPLIPVKSKMLIES